MRPQPRPPAVVAEDGDGPDHHHAVVACDGDGEAVVGSDVAVVPLDAYRRQPFGCLDEL